MKSLWSAFFIFFFFPGSAQLNNMRWPLDTPCTITGNYGELRPNHFHSGIDFSTGGKVNRPVYAVETGYVSRIRISATGYGNAVYITHPGNRVTVYAHLNSLSLKLSKVVTDEQYSRKSFEVELLPAPGLLPVNKGELVGLSGNTGGSTGPHLHFEIRDGKSETPLNPLSFFNLPDVIPPVLEAIAFYDLGDSLNPELIRTARIHPATLSYSFVVHKNPVGFAFSAYDQLKKNGNRNNVYSAKLFLDEKLIYAHRLRTIDFADNRYVNEFSETAGKLKFQKCFLPTLYPPALYDVHDNKGNIIFRDTLSHSLRIVLEDEKGNKTEHSFRVRSTAPLLLKKQDTGNPLFVDCRKDFFFKDRELSVFIPASTLYHSATLNISTELASSSGFIIGPALNVRSAYVLALAVPQNLSGNSSKLVLRFKGGVAPGVTKNDSVYFYLKSTGTFVLLPDLEPPAIRTALSAKKLAKMRHFASFGFRISDKLSGIAKYALLVNGVWALASYDAKSDVLTYDFDERTPTGPLKFQVEAEDRCGNKTTFTYTLRR
jgi:hypothetical protein